MVIDASVAASWFLKNQANPGVDRLFLNAGGLEFVAPLYFSVELRNVLVKREHLGVLTPEQTAFSLAKAHAVIRVAGGDMLHEADRALPLARLVRLSLYDAIYLEKAIRKRRPLASRDRRLIEAAIEQGVDVLDLRD